VEPVSPQPLDAGNISPPAGEHRRQTDNCTFHTVTLKKYLARVSSGGAAARINNRGVALAEKGQFKEAAILFEELLRENNNAVTALNNLGVLYEISGNREKAFALYSRACLMEPDNEYFRHNFLYMVRHEALPEIGENKRERVSPRR
jgi:tetratricopeptide (TPR) repeat protein